MGNLFASHKVKLNAILIEDTFKFRNELKFLCTDHYYLKCDDIGHTLKGITHSDILQHLT